MTYMDPEILSYVNKAQLCNDEARLLFNPPCQLYLQITGFISPNPNNVNSTDIPKSQNAFLLYRKNYAAKRKSLGCRKNWKIISKEAGDAWKKESDKVTSYFNILARLALEKHKLIYEKAIPGNQLPKKFIFVTQQQPEPQKEISYKTNDKYCTISSSSSPHSSFSSFPCTNDNSSSSYQQSEPQQKQIDNNNNAISLSHPSPSSSTFLHTNHNTRSFYQQPELLQKQEDNNNNNDCAISTPPYPYHSSCTNDHPNSPSSNSSTSFLPCPISSDYNTLPINYNNNVINKTNALLESTQFDIITNLNNEENILKEFQRFLQDEQTYTPFNGADFWRLAGVFCHKVNSN